MQTRSQLQCLFETGNSWNGTFVETALAGDRSPKTGTVPPNEHNWSPLGYEETYQFLIVLVELCKSCDFLVSWVSHGVLNDQYKYMLFYTVKKIENCSCVFTGFKGVVKNVITGLRPHEKQKTAATKRLVFQFWNQEDKHKFIHADSCIGQFWQS